MNRSQRRPRDSASRVVVVTGCSSGLGLATALKFARTGDRVYATMRDPAKASTIESIGAREQLNLTVRELDVTNDTAVHDTADDILVTEQRIDVLVNNAGVARVGAVELLPDELVRETFETNFFGPLRLIRAVLPSMRARGGGVIVNVSSVSARLWGKPITWAYDASKHALGALSDGLAHEVEPFGIRVRVVEPGFFVTDMLQNSVHWQQPNSPYAQLDQAVSHYFERSVADAPEAGVVAEAIVAAVSTPQFQPAHVPVGDDACALITAMTSATESGWAAGLRQSLGL